MANAPLITFPTPPTTPERDVVTMNPMPTVSTSANCHSWDQGNPGRSAFLMPQISHNAFCIAPATPRAPSSSKTMPMPSATPEPGMDPSFDWISGPITGYWDTALLTSSSRSPWSFLSTMSSTVTRTSSSGKIAAKAK